ncbi:MAG: 16S rRNA (uracil(1498)-N(3))-methyltransferase [Alphaproteobacteria bacterium]|nr:16S rRNA (uracil(1498)-N(3))-methyltransferase [Alphaproteobacteria bacterium]
MSETSKIRIYVAEDLKPKTSLVLKEEQSHYLCNVMRLKEGDCLRCFNGVSGEFMAKIKRIHKKQTEIDIGQQIRMFYSCPDIWVLFSPLKKDRTDFLIEKSVELGVSALIPVITNYGITDKVKTDRLQSQIIEASEQCERLDIPKLESTRRLDDILKNWDSNRRLFFLDERGNGIACKDAFTSLTGDKAALLIGPEGGFSNQEAELLYSLPYVTAVSLGPRILRAETACVAALSVWQSISGDWK